MTMSRRAADFMQRWIAENVTADLLIDDIREEHKYLECCCPRNNRQDIGNRRKSLISFL
jgi:hypothetical protein